MNSKEELFKKYILKIISTNNNNNIIICTNFVILPSEYKSTVSNELTYRIKYQEKEYIVVKPEVYSNIQQFCL